MPSENACQIFRVSTAGQTEDNQVSEVETHCTAKGYNVLKKLYLHDVSASKEGTEAEASELEANMAEVLADIKAGEYTTVVVAHSSRIDRRDPKKAMAYLLAVDMAGGRVESVREPDFNFDSIGGWLNVVMAQHANHEYSVTLKANIAAGKAKIKANGAMDGMAPWGMEAVGEKHHKRLVATDLGRTWVPLIYAKVIAGVSLAAICEWLTAEGVPAPGLGRRVRVGEDAGGNAIYGRRTEARWWPKSLLRMVRNPSYKGLHCPRVTGEDGRWTGRYSATPEHRCEALVDAGTWQRAQTALASVSRRRGPAVADRAMLTGAVFCGNCAGPMYRVTPSSHPYYRCYGKGPSRKGCGNMVDLVAADAAVSKLITEKFTHPVLARQLVPGNGAELDARLDDIKAEIGQLAARDLDDAEYDAELARLRAERDKVKGTERTADHYELLPTNDSYATLWETLEPAQRGPWLKNNGITVRVTREGAAVAQDLLWDGEGEPPALGLPLLPSLDDLAPGSGRVAYWAPFAPSRRPRADAGRARGLASYKGVPLVRPFPTARPTPSQPAPSPPPTFLSTRTSPTRPIPARPVPTALPPVG